SQFDHYHIAIKDAVLDAGPGGFDEQGDPYERTHELEGTENAPVVVDHLGLTLDAFMASDPLYVGEEPVEDDELYGYQVYLHIQRENAVRRGMLRADEEIEEDPEEWQESDAEDETGNGDEEGE